MEVRACGKAKLSVRCLVRLTAIQPSVYRAALQERQSLSIAVLLSRIMLWAIQFPRIFGVGVFPDPETIR